MPMPPSGHLHQIIRANQPHKLAIRKSILQLCDGIGGEPSAQFTFQVANPDARVIGRFLR